MNIAQPARCIFCTFTNSAKSGAAARRSLHSTPIKSARRKPRYPSVKAEDDTNRVNLERLQPIKNDDIKKHFTPQQQAAISAAKGVVTADGIKRSSASRHPWTPKYYDDMTQIDPVVDKPVKAPWSNIDDNARLKTDEEINQDLYNFMSTMPDDDVKAAEAWRKFDENMRLTVGKGEAERNPRSAMAPSIPKIEDPSGSKKQTSRGKRSEGGDSSKEMEPSPALLRLMQMTGMDRRQISGLRTTMLDRHRVVNQTRMGKIQKFYVISVAGNGNGLVGIGEGKSDEYPAAIQQSQYRAIRNMQPVMRYENRTVFGSLDGKVSATELDLYARPPGFGLRCQATINEICKCVGIQDLSARITRARTPMNIAKATMKALLSQKDPEDIARARGKKLVDVRKVYYANAV